MIAELIRDLMIDGLYDSPIGNGLLGEIQSKENFERITF